MEMIDTVEGILYERRGSVCLQGFSSCHTASKIPRFMIKSVCICNRVVNKTQMRETGLGIPHSEIPYSAFEMGKVVEACQVIPNGII
ncbi:MAG: hypothetical protein PHT33_03730 [bacterium]|nr:hypothetical protein [bacterium]